MHWHALALDNASLERPRDAASAEQHLRKAVVAGNQMAAHEHFGFKANMDLAPPHCRQDG